MDPGNNPPGNLTLIPALNALVDPCVPTTGRADLDLALLSGIPAGTLGLPGTQDTQRQGGPVKADVLHLNTNVAPTTGTGAASSRANSIPPTWRSLPRSPSTK